jgi:hypothetical protein
VCLKGGQPLFTMEDAIISQKVVEAVEKSLAEDRIVPIT